MPKYITVQQAKKIVCRHWPEEPKGFTSGDVTTIVEAQKTVLKEILEELEEYKKQPFEEGK